MNDDAMNFFTGRQPTFNFTKRGPVVRGFRSRRGAPQAEPPQGLTSGSNAMSAVDWVSRFSDTGQQMKGAAAAELGVSPGGSGSAGPVGDGGIAGQTLDAAFGPGYWTRLVGRGPTAPAPDALDTPAPFMPRSPSTPFGVPKPLTGALGDKASDRANFAANRSLYAPGGAQGLWGSRFTGGAAPTTSGWERPNLASSFAIEDRYRAPGSRDKRIGPAVPASVNRLVM